MFKALAIALVGYAATVDAARAPKGRRICISNMAGFVMYWHMEDLNTGNVGVETDNYPIDKIKCQDISSVPNVEEGDMMMSVVKAVLGSEKNVDTAVIYDPSGDVVSFSCTGATLTYSCKLNGQDMMVELDDATQAALLQ